MNGYDWDGTLLIFSESSLFRSIYSLILGLVMRQHYFPTWGLRPLGQQEMFSSLSGSGNLGAIAAIALPGSYHHSQLTNWVVIAAKHG